MIQLRMQDQDERDEHDSLLDLYTRTMGQTGPEPTAQAA
jgi:uncharacterized protein (UPF0335 family)